MLGQAGPTGMKLSMLKSRVGRVGYPVVGEQTMEAAWACAVVVVVLGSDIVDEVDVVSVVPVQRVVEVVLVDLVDKVLLVLVEVVLVVLVVDVVLVVRLVELVVVVRVGLGAHPLGLKRRT